MSNRTKAFKLLLKKISSKYDLLTVEFWEASNNERYTFRVVYDIIVDDKYIYDKESFIIVDLTSNNVTID